MLFSHVRVMIAGIAAVGALCASPARSRADVQVLVEELNASSTVVSSAITTGTPINGSVSFSINLPSYLGSGTVTTTSALGGTPSLTPSFSGVFTNSGISSGAAATDTIRIIVTDDGFSTSGGTGTLNNQAATSNGISGGGEQVNTFSQIFSAPLSGTPASSTTAVASGTPVGSATSVASAASPANPNLSPLTTENVSGLPSTFAIQQTLVVSFAQNAGQTLSGTFGGSGGAFIVPDVAAVPAPGGLALALIGLPLLGLRRAARARAAA